MCCIKMKMNRFDNILALMLVLLCLILKAKCELPDNKNEPEAGNKIPVIFNYEKYIDQFHKRYSLIETMNKAKLFFGRTLKIFKHNILFKLKKVNYFLAQNDFTDMTAEELRDKYLRYDDLDMKPVAEANEYPDEPADSNVEENDEVTESRSSEKDGSEVREKQTKQTKPVLNFLEEDGIEDVRLMLRELKHKPKIANKIASLVDLRDETSSEEAKRIEAAKVENNIENRPMVDSNNENYDIDTITSYGLFNIWHPDMSTENYARFLLDEQFDADLKIEVYPTPTIPREKVLKEPSQKEENFGLMNSVKGLFDFFSNDDWLDEDYDLDDDEYLSVPNIGAKKEKPKIDKEPKSLNNKKKKDEKVVAYDIDWRQSGCITKPKTQMSCNSCYAFTALSLMEFFHCRQTKKLTEFSAQYIVDCGPKLANLGGCRGGKISRVGHFITKYGIELNVLYPYVGLEKQCPYSEKDRQKNKNGYLRPEITHWQNFPEMEAWTKWLPKSPIIVGINMPSDFLAYGGGIHDGSDCNKGMVHALLLVGSGTENGKKFWLLKNSYSEDWGESGYFKLSKSAPFRCFNTATVVRVNFKV